MRGLAVKVLVIVILNQTSGQGQISTCDDCIIRRCCAKGQVMNESNKCANAELVNGSVIELRLNEDQLVAELRHLTDLRDFYHVLENSSCSGRVRYFLEPKLYPEDVFVLQKNASLVTKLTVYPPTDYCLIWTSTQNATSALVCPKLPASEVKKHIYPIGIILSAICLFITLIIYIVVDDLRNLPGKILMHYIGCLLLAYASLALVKYDHNSFIPAFSCLTLAFIIHFSFLASFFWLNVMCFDIWWTFGGFRSLQGSVKQRERKKFIMYSIYAWGCASLLTGVCIIMDLVPDIPKNFIKPEFGSSSCWFTTEKAKAIYFYGPMGATVLCNIYLFISTAMKIVQHKKDTAHHLKGSESRRHDDNKQWFNLYLKLFIVMGINWSMEIISWLFDTLPDWVWYITDLTNTLQGVIIFIIFVWKDKIKRLLLKRLGCQERNFASRNSTRSAYHSSASRTCTTSFPMQEKTPVVIDPSFRTKSSSVEQTECN